MRNNKRELIKYDRLKVLASSGRKQEEEEEEEEEEQQVAKGFVPVLVGAGEEVAERFMVQVELFRHPRFTVLLETAAEEFGYEQRGVIRIPCSTEHFRRLLRLIS